MDSWYLLPIGRFLQLLDRTIEREVRVTRKLLRESNTYHMANARAMGKT